MSGYNGSLWVTYHKRNKLEGMYSIMSICNSPCKFFQFCYAKKYASFRPNIAKKSKENYKALTESEFEPPLFPPKSIVRWFSFGSCNGDSSVIEKVKETAKCNPRSNFGIWLEPPYFHYADSLFEHENISVVYSHKELDNPQVVPQTAQHNSFNVVSSKDELNRLLKEHYNAHHCIGKCKACGYVCYMKTGITVIEKKK